MTPFFITGLPRSRTAWLANFFTWRESFCHHDALRMGLSVEALREQLESVPARYVGDSDSGLVMFAEQIVKEWPDARWLLVQRPVRECLESYQNYFPRHPYPSVPVLTGADAATVFDYMRRHCERLSGIVPSLNLAVMDADAMDDETSMRNMWQWILPTVPFPLGRWRMLTTMNVRIISEKVQAPGLESGQVGKWAGENTEPSRHVPLSHFPTFPPAVLSPSP